MARPDSPDISTIDLARAARHYPLIRRVLDEISKAGPGLSVNPLAERLPLQPDELRRVLMEWSGADAETGLHLMTPEATSRLFVRHFAKLSAAPAAHDNLTLTSDDEFRKGKVLQIRWTLCLSPFGPAMIMATGHGICAIGFTADASADECFRDLSSRWPEADYRKDDNLASLAQSTFAPSSAPPPLHLIGSVFQIRIWRALARIPMGQITTYGEIGRYLGCPTASRAIGNAVGRNPISFLVPCHRVLRGNHGLGGYHWGLLQKRAMLAWEALRQNPGQSDAARLIPE